MLTTQFVTSTKFSEFCHFVSFCFCFKNIPCFLLPYLLSIYFFKGMTLYGTNKINTFLWIMISCLSYPNQDPNTIIFSLNYKLYKTNNENEFDKDFIALSYSNVCQRLISISTLHFTRIWNAKWIFIHVFYCDSHQFSFNSFMIHSIVSVKGNQIEKSWC